MGTLTANSQRLPDHCDHKLPTSCRLTSIPQCCACADERAHATSYSTYIDGIGFVSRGTRWQRYCWFCKEFWQQRVHVSGLGPAQTRIPEVPDQTVFLERWYDFHRGYRIVREEDGSEERMAVLGEPFEDVAPGDLPRTLEELRAGRLTSEANAVAQGGQEQVRPEMGPSLDETLEGLFQAASIEDTPVRDTAAQSLALQRQRDAAFSRPPTHVAGQVMTPAVSRNREYQARRIAALRRELYRVRNGIERVISGLRDLGESVPDSSEVTGRLNDLGRILDDISRTPSQEQAGRATQSVNGLSNTASSSMSGTDRTLAAMQTRVDDARTHLNEARQSRDQAASELNLAEEEHRTSATRLRQLKREQRTAENYTRVFGTREEIERQGAEYESPIGGMFTRAWERFRVAEEVRQEERTLRQVLEDEQHTDDHVIRLAGLGGTQPDVWGVRHIPGPTPLRQVTNLSTENFLADAMRDMRVLEDADPPVLETSVGPEVPPAGQAHRESAVPLHTPPEAIPSREEEALADYYALLRRQDRTQDVTDSANFPESTLNRAVAQQAHDTAERNQIWHTMADAYRRSINDDHTPGQQESGVQTMSEAWRQSIGEELLSVQEENIQDTASRFVADPQFRRRLSLPENVTDAITARLLRGVVNESDRQYLRRLESNRVISGEDGDLDETAEIWADVMYLIGEFHDDDVFRNIIAVSDDSCMLPFRAWNWTHGDVHALIASRDHADWAGLLQNVELVWATGLPTARALRWQQNGREFHIDGNTAPNNSRHFQANVEAMAEAYQISSTVSQRSGLPGPAQLRMLDLLQRGDRTPENREVLVEMLRNPEVVMRANEVRMQAASGQDRGGPSYGYDLRATFSSRAEGRPTERAANQGNELQIVGGPLRYRNEDHDELSGGMSSSPPSDTEDDEDDAKGLDATDSGRPETKTDEEMTIKLECRICYTQMAEIACLPCGHLVMCQWCSDQHSPVMQHDRTRLRRAARCPVCRKGIRQKVRVFRA